MGGLLAVVSEFSPGASLGGILKRSCCFPILIWSFPGWKSQFKLLSPNSHLELPWVEILIEVVVSSGDSLGGNFNSSCGVPSLISSFPEWKS
jgi:hypothetical protein